MKQVKLATQLNVIFTVVTLLTSLVFIIALNRVFHDFRVQQNIEQLEVYYDEVKGDLNSPHISSYNGYVIAQNNIVVRSYNMGLLDDNYTANQLINELSVWPGNTKEEEVGSETYYFMIYRNIPSHITVIVFTSEDYLNALGNSFGMLVQISFIALVLLGNLIILIWSRITVERVKRLKGEVELMTKNSYTVPIEIDGNDEITELAQTIEKMRREIHLSEKTKQEMLQNISHDFKTPIAVIQSYAEAISDGISDVSEANVIIKQADVLNQKVKQLLELNKLEYLKTQEEFESVKIKDIIGNIVNNHKYRTHIEFILDLDDSTYFGISENFYIAFNNIIDNALRYAKTKIEITLVNKKLTFYNDGEPISQNFINQMFKPYEKGEKGQFGLGMSIVQKTCIHFNLVLKVENINQGVMFTIEPL
ncbi:MAG: HAMP domain-containing histidine kinase [Acholeplasmataceae bacterium]|nr:HAMP domain-containing histidine kinase [Acholeplasmataceae bacterium]